MIRLWYYLIWGYVPKWEVIDRIPLKHGEHARGERFVLQCKITGNIKFKDVI